MTEIAAGTDPFDLFSRTYEQAAQNAPFDYTAATLATVDSAGQPTARIVLLKGMDPAGFVFYTNYLGRKGRELDAHPAACLNFFWPWIGQQVRIDGTTSHVTDAESDAYFASRPRASQIGAWASNQSEPLESRELLVQRVVELEAKYDGREIPRPAHWGGYRLVPSAIEFWYNGENRLHDRFLFHREKLESNWTITRLNP